MTTQPIGLRKLRMTRATLNDVQLHAPARFLAAVVHDQGGHVAVWDDIDWHVRALNAQRGDHDRVEGNHWAASAPAAVTAWNDAARIARLDQGVTRLIAACDKQHCYGTDRRNANGMCAKRSSSEPRRLLMVHGTYKRSVNAQNTRTV
jgi:hypothetical protein